jgi:hypothetical protein
MTVKKPNNGEPAMTRRIFIQRSLVAATVISLPSLLAACGGGSSGSNDSADSATSSNATSSSSSSSSSAASTASFAVLSDVHLYDLDTLGSNADLTTYLTQDRKMLKESVPTFTSALADIATWNVDFLLISGDLTKDGELVNHKLMASKLKAFGKPVYVIPGNHDINNPDAKSYNGTTAAVDQVTPATFQSVYADYGYGKAIYTDSNSLSYIAEPVSGVWLFAIDSCKYSNNAALGYPVTSGAISTATLGWITDKLAEAKVKGKTVIGMMHHGLIEHFAGQSSLFAEYLVDDRANVAATLAAAGLKVMFTGHFHANDVVSATYSGNTLYDVETGSTVTAPCPYRLCKFDRSAATLAISTSVVSAITVTNSNSDYTNSSSQTFQAFAKDYLTTGLNTLVTAILVADYGITDSTTQQQLLALIVPAMVAHYAGDESLTDSTTLATLNYMAASTSATTKLVGQMVLSLWNDAAPADNKLTLSFSA